MKPWNEHSYSSVTKGTNYIVSLATELQRKLELLGENTPADEVLFLLHQIAGMAESMSHLADLAKVRAILTPKDL